MIIGQPHGRQDMHVARRDDDDAGRLECIAKASCRNRQPAAPMLEIDFPDADDGNGARRGRHQFASGPGQPGVRQEPPQGDSRVEEQPHLVFLEGLRDLRVHLGREGGVHFPDRDPRQLAPPPSAAFPGDGDEPDQNPIGLSYRPSSWPLRAACNVRRPCLHFITDGATGAPSPGGPRLGSGVSAPARKVRGAR